jgi:hypothetical protein
MGIKLCALVVAIAIAGGFRAQAQEAHQCASHYYFEQWQQQHPEILDRYKEVEAQLAPLFNAITPEYDRKTRAVVYRIPTVVHVLHKYGAEDISDNQVFDAIRILNNDFNKLNSDTSAIVSSFVNVAARVEIEFVLARKDPQGTCTNGIDRIYTFKADRGDDEAKINQWDRQKYFNIWTVNAFARAGVAGYSYFPSSFGSGFGALNSLYDGVIILHDYMGAVGTGSAGTSRALTHESGHWLELPHPWGLTNNPGVACGDDNINDTPPTKGFTTCALNTAMCTAGVVENAQNFMDYSYCSNMFTSGQRSKMRSIIANNVGNRGDLVSASTASSTGIANPPADCPVKADFGAVKYFGCVGSSSFTIRNRSFGDTIASSAWTIADGTYTATGNTDFGVTFPSAGWKDVTLTATSNAGSSTKTKTKHIYVSDPNQTQSLGYFQSFDLQAYNDTWPTFNIYDNEVKFSVVGNGYGGGNCLKLSTLDKRNNGNFRFVNTYGGDVDELISPAFNLAGSSGVKLGFFTTGATDVFSQFTADDQLKVLYSKNCGNNWITLATYDSADLVNKGAVSGDYTPTNTSDWVARTINLPVTAMANGVYFKFQYTSSSAGNNFYIDNISVSTWPTALGTDLKGAEILMVTPTVNTGSFVVSTNIADATITLCDIGGKQLRTYSSAQMTTGGGAISISEGLAAGLYFVQAMRSGSVVATQKIVVQ